MHFDVQVFENSGWHGDIFHYYVQATMKYRNSRILADADWATKYAISELPPKREFRKGHFEKYIFFSLKIAAHKKNNRTFFILYLLRFGCFIFI